MDFNLNEQHRLWQRAVHDFVAAEVQARAAEVDETGEFNWQAARKGAPLGLLGMYIPEEYGGSALDAISIAIAFEELGWGCGSTALALAAHNCLGSTPIAMYGTIEQKRQWLPILADGKHRLACLALTEPGAGSDLQGGVITRAVRDGSSWRLTGEKAWCTNASIGECIITLARTGAAGGSSGLSMFIVPADAPGLSVGSPEKKMGLHGSPSSAVAYNDVKIPAEGLLGPEGRGLQQTLETLDAGRITIGAISVGLARAALERSVSYAGA
jgi:alkylation response protein AidB-like acyl-CoA dehydrogenase